MLRKIYIDFLKIGITASYKSTLLVKTQEELLNCMENIKERMGPVLLLIKIKISHNRDLKSLEKSPREYKEDFMKHLNC